MTLRAWDALLRKFPLAQLQAEASAVYLRSHGIEFVLELTADNKKFATIDPMVRALPAGPGWLGAIDILEGAARKILPPPYEIRVTPLFPRSLRSGNMHAVMQRLDRFVCVRVRGLSFDDLGAAGGNAYDMAYDFADALNQALGGNAVLASAPSTPFARGVGCSHLRHNNPETDMGWAFAAMDILTAWEKTTQSGASPRGRDIRIGHPDTGYSEHPDLAGPRLLKSLGWDVVDDDPDAKDALNTTIFNSHPGHGTSTATLIVSGWTIGSSPSQTDTVPGVAPQAELVPIRTLDSTAFVWNSDVAKAVDHAVAQGCHVISLSVGGLVVPGLETAIGLAIQSGCIVVCASGQCVNKVVFPAAFPASIAISASQEDKTPWTGSCRGAAVAACAPGEMITCTEIRADGTFGAGRGTGTSFACAYVAGLAALWLGHYGYDWLKQRYQACNLQAAFKAALQSSVDTPAGWDNTRWGAGIVSASKLLDTLPDPQALPGCPTEPTSFLDLILRIFLVDALGEAEARRHALRLAGEITGSGDEKAIVSIIERFGPEIVNLLLEQDESDALHDGKESLTSPSALARFFARRGSARLRATLKRSDVKPRK